MSYSQLLEQHHRVTFANNVMLVAQQRRNPFMGAVTEMPATGEAHSVADLIDAGEYSYAEERSRRNPENPVSGSRRWVVMPPEIESGQYIDKEDKFRAAMDPTGKIVETHTLRVTRGWADRILGIRKQSDGSFAVTDGGIMGKAREGKTPGVGTDLPAGQIVADGASGLSIEKLRAAKLLLNKADFGLEEENTLYAAVTPEQIDDLLAIAQASSNSLNAFNVEQLRTGKPTSLLGITWIVTNRLPKNSDGHRLCPIWDKNNIIAGVWQGIQGNAWNDTSAKNLPYVHVGAMVDVVRAQDKGVVILECVE